MIALRGDCVFSDAGFRRQLQPNRLWPRARPYARNYEKQRQTMKGQIILLLKPVDEVQVEGMDDVGVVLALEIPS